jgi:MFS family permease
VRQSGSHLGRFFQSRSTRRVLLALEACLCVRAIRTPVTSGLAIGDSARSDFGARASRPPDTPVNTTAAIHRKRGTGQWDDDTHVQQHPIASSKLGVGSASAAHSSLTARSESWLALHGLIRCHSWVILCRRSSPPMRGLRLAPSLVTLFAICFLDLFSGQMVATLLQDRMIGFFNGGDECIGVKEKNMPEGCKHGLSMTETVSGWQAGISAVFAFVLSPLMGAISDAYGRVPIMLITLLFGTLFPMTLLILSSYTSLSLWVYIAWRSVTYGFSSIAIAFAYIADIAHASKRTELFGYLMAVFSVGSVLGPLAATYLTLSEATVFACAGGISLVSCIIGYYFLGESLSLELQYQKRRQIMAKRNGPETGIVVGQALYREESIGQPPAQQQHQQNGGAVSTVATLNEPLLVDVVSSSDPNAPSSSPRAPSSFQFSYVCSNPLSDVLILNRTWLLRKLAMIIFLLCVIVFGQIGISYLYLHARFGMDQQQHAILSAVQGVCSILTQSILLGIASRRFSNKSIMCVGLACLVVSNILYATMWTQNLVFLSAPVASIAFMCFPAITSLKANAMAPDEQGAIQGALSAVRSVGGGLGPLLFNQLLSMTQDTKYESLPFFVAAGISIIAVAISVTVTEFIWTPTPDGKPTHDIHVRLPSEGAIPSIVEYTPVEQVQVDEFVVNEHQLNHQ